MSTKPRDKWTSQLDFLLSIVGFSVDLANVWRFPYLVYTNGGGAFLIPYFLMLIFGALPLFYMELILGQLQREGCISVWKLCPFFKGIGVSQFLINITVSFYYNIIIGWALYFLFATIVSNLPWMSCGPGSTPYCLTVDQMKTRTDLKKKYEKMNITWPPGNLSNRAQLPAQEYFERQVLNVQESSGLSNIGLPEWRVAVCCAIAYMILFFCLWKGIKTSGKVVYVTALLPYLLLTVMLIQGCILPGSLDGIIHFIKPDLEKLKLSQTWLLAAVQIFYSVGAGFGVHVTLASYNDSDYKCLRSCLITVFANSLTSLLAGFTVFAYLGYMSHITGQEVTEVANEGPGLVFQVYPIAVGTLPAAPLWSIFLFLLLVMLGIDSSMGGIESLIAALRDEFRGFFDRHPRFSRELTTFLVILVSYLGALVITTKGGILILQILDRAVGIPLVIAALCQAIAVSWFYGLPQFCYDIQRAMGYVPNILWRICWKLISPAFIIAVIAFSFMGVEPLAYRFGAYHAELDGKINMTETLVYTFPEWSNILMWCITGLQIFMIPLFMVIAVIKYRSFYIAVSPTYEHYQIRQGSETTLRRKPNNWFSFGPISAKSKDEYELSDSPVQGHVNRGMTESDEVVYY